jgi:hypothetical protein
VDVFEHEGGAAPICFSFKKDHSLLQSTFCFLGLWLAFIIIMHKDVIVDREQLAVNVEKREGAAV